MDGNLNALGLILVITITAFFTARFGRRPDSLARVVKAFAGAFALSFLALSLSVHFCHAGDPIHHWTIAALCLGCLATFVNWERIALGAGATVVVLTAALAIQFLGLVHTESYTGSPEWATRGSRAEALSKLRLIRERLPLYETDAKSYPAGWLAETSLWGEFPNENAALLRGKSVAIQPFWHSWLTGLYRKSYKPTAVWYPGGPLKDALPKLEFRERVPHEAG
jgi:hypothetical protein